MQASTENRPLGIYLLIGLVQGLALWIASEGWPQGAAWRALCSALLVFTVIGGWQLQLMWGALREAGRGPRILLAALLPALLAAALAVQFDQPRWYYLDETSGTLLLWSNLLLAFLLTPFIQAREPERRGRAEYATLYRHAVNNGLLLFIAQLLLLVFWLLILLWAGLFKLVGIEAFETFFESAGFVWIASATVFALGLWIGLERGQMVDALRNGVQAMCRFLLPLTTLILLLFLLFLPFTGVGPLWATRHATPILLTLAFAHLVLINGVVQDGRQPSPYPRPLRLLIEASAHGLPILTGLAAYALWLRIDQYGLTPERVFAAVATLMAVLHALAFATAVWRRGGGWLCGLRTSNPALALFAALLLVGLHVPPLSPLQLSAASQYGRLLDAGVPLERTDLGALRFQLGEPGRTQLARLRQRLAGPDLEPARVEALQIELQRLDEADSYWGWRREQTVALAPPVSWIGEALADEGGSLARAVAPQDCADDCRLFAIDLDGDGQSEALLLRGERLRIVPVLQRNAAGDWRWIGQLRVAGGQALNGDTLAEQLRAGEVERVVPRYQALRIGDLRLEPSISE
ncbi:DUF4153 domain-containing protein [Stutzerimonas marianensis]